MTAALQKKLPTELIAEFEKKYFWWEPVGSQPRSDARILAQTMNLASFADVRRLEIEAGPNKLHDVMIAAEPGWFSEKSWEFWRGRLAGATSSAVPEEPPRRSFHARAI